MDSELLVLRREVEALKQHIQTQNSQLQTLIDIVSGQETAFGEIAARDLHQFLENRNGQGAS